MAGQLVYVTGPSGTGVRAALHRFVRYLKELGQDEGTLPRVVELEAHLEDIAQPSVADVLGYQQATLFRIMQLPKPLLESLWLEAFERALGEVKTARTAGRDALLTFHAIWYHHQNREYISAVNFPRLREDDAKADMVVTLIDDIYDVRMRLSKKHGLFANRLDESLSELEDIIHKLLLILDWRMTEQLVSEKIASIATVPPHQHFVLAVKHPFSTFRTLLGSASDTHDVRPSAYHSHPISEPRAMRRIGMQSEADSVIQGIRDMAAKLRERLILFEPTSIDEARFDFEISLEDGQFFVLPRLGERWPLPVEESNLLFDPPPRTGTPEFGTEWERKSKEVIDALENGQPLPYQDELRAVSGLLALLRAVISRHINLRDHKLIDQSNWLIAYRPFFRGKLATGVQEEIEYADRLVRSEIRRNPTFVLHPPEDERLRTVETLSSFLMNSLQQVRLLQGDEGKVRQAAEAVDPDSLSNGKTDLELGRTIRTAVEGVSMEVRRATPMTPMRREMASIAEAEDEELGREFREFLACYLDDLAQESVRILREDLTPVVFAERVTQQIVGAS